MNGSVVCTLCNKVVSRFNRPCSDPDVYVGAENDCPNMPGNELPTLDGPHGVMQCTCGYPRCQTFWLTGIGHFAQGSGFDRAEALYIANVLNIMAKAREQAKVNGGSVTLTLEVGTPDSDQPLSVV